MAALIRAQFQITGTTGLPGLCTIYFGGGSSPTTVAEATDALGRVRAFWSGVASLLPTTVAVNAVNPVQTLDDVTGALLFLTSATPPAQVLGSGSNELPAMAMLIAQWFTSTIVGGRLLRGHTNVGPLAAVVSAGNGAPTAASRTTLLGAMATLGTGSTSIVQRVWHRPGPAGGGGSSAPVTTYGTSTQFGVLRSRRD